MLTNIKTILAVLITALWLTACGQEGGSASSTTTWQIETAPEEVLSIKDAKASAQEGDIVTITGLIGGKAEGSVTEDSGIFLIVDDSIPTCADKGDDHCPTPWDYCCEPRDSLLAGMATVLVQDAAGNPINLAGLEPMSKVTVSGVVGPRPDAQVLTITTTGVYVDKPAS